MDKAKLKGPWEQYCQFIQNKAHLYPDAYVELAQRVSPETGVISPSLEDLIRATHMHFQETGVYGPITEEKLFRLVKRMDVFCHWLQDVLGDKAHRAADEFLHVDLAPLYAIGFMTTDTLDDIARKKIEAICKAFIDAHEPDVDGAMLQAMGQETGRLQDLVRAGDALLASEMANFIREDMMPSTHMVV